MNTANGSRRVVVTGLGVVSPIGSTPESLWTNLIEGKSGVAPFASLPRDVYPMSFGGEVPEFTGEIDNFGELSPEVKKAIRKGVKLMCRETQMGVAAAQRAIAHAGLVAAKFDPERVGLSFGAGYMLTEPVEYSAGILKCMTDEKFDFARWGAEGMRQVTPLWLLKYLPNMPACHIAIYNDLRGPNNSLTHGEAAANLAVGEAYQVIARGSADVMVAGATGTKIHKMRTIQAALQEELSPGGGNPAEVSRPFDKHRTGMVVGEGAGVVVLEELESARKRGATIYGEIIGAASSCVADRNRVSRRDVALANVMRGAMRKSGATPKDVAFVHAHGLSTHASDKEEARAIRQVFGDAADRLPVVASKSHFGNLGAGSGAVELVASLLALHHKRLFPVLNYSTPDPECPISPVTTNDRPAGKSFMNLSVNARGQASGLLVRAVD